jgi:archaea-specific DNA-binding protein
MNEIEQKTKIPDNVIFVGKKPFMSYVNAASYILREHDKIEINARGKSISTAVDLAEVLEKRFMKGKLEKVEISTDSEVFDSKKIEGRKITVSNIKIVLRKK